MPSFVLTGHPCVGKTTFAELLKERAMQHKSGMIQKVIIINEESACPDFTKAQCYATSLAEKKTRGALKSEFDREVSRANSTTLVVLDSMNYIKGFRYELHCISKAAGERHGVIWILNSASVAKEYNQKRHQTDDTSENGKCFKEKLMDELMLRYEPPDARNRWDKPLYRIDLTPKDASSSSDGKPTANVAAQDALQRSVYNMHALSDSINDDSVAGTTVKKKSTFKKAGFRRAKPKTPTQQTPENQQGTSAASHDETTASDPTSNKEVEQNAGETNSAEETTPLTLEQRIDEILDSFLLDIQPLKQGMSTQQHVTAEANVLHEVDSITQKVCNSIMSAQKLAGVMGTTSVSMNVGENLVKFTMRRTMSLPELQRLRRQYIRWVGTHPPEDTTKQGIITSFVAYIDTQV